MTSIMRRYSQIEPRIKYFTVFATGVELWIPIDIFQTNTPSIMDISGFITSYAPSILSFSQGGATLLKDLGRQITVYNSSIQGSPHVALFRQVVQVNGLNSEGIQLDAGGNNIGMGFICVWADETPGPSIESSSIPFRVADVARTG